MPTPTALTPTDLAAVTAFADLPADTVAGLLAHGEGRTDADDETAIEPGQPADWMMPVVRGGL